MHDETINIILLGFMFVVFLNVMRARGMGRRHRRLQEEIDQLRSAPAAPPALPPGASKEQVQRLEERVRVLEQIVTDRGFNLAAEIEALRDVRPSVRTREMEGNEP